jgi:hypothetical protein
VTKSCATGRCGPAILAGLGRFGLSAPLVALVVGIAVPPLASLGHLLLVPCIVLLLCTSVVLAEPGPLRGTELLRPAALVCANLLLSVGIAAMPAPLPALSASWPWFALVAAAPPAGSAALIASMLGLPVRPLLFAQMAGFLVLPLTAPLVAALLFTDLFIDASALAGRVALLLCLPCLAGPAIRRWLGPQRRHRLTPQIKGLGTLSLVGIGLGTATGLAAPHTVASLPQVVMGLGFVLLLGTGIGALSALGAPRGVTAGMMIAGGVRNLTVLWGACVGLAPPDAALVLQLGTVITLVVPVLLAAGCALVALCRRRSAEAAPPHRGTLDVVEPPAAASVSLGVAFPGVEGVAAVLPGTAHGS